MNGYHIVRTFIKGESDLTLPTGWKPFAAFPILLMPGESKFVVLARKWISNE